MFEKKQDILVKAVNSAFQGIGFSLVFMIMVLSFCKRGTLISIFFTPQGFSNFIIFLGLGAIFPLVTAGIINIAKAIRLNPKNIDKYYANAEIIRGYDNVVSSSYVAPAIQASNDQPHDNIVSLNKSSQHTVPEVAPETDDGHCVSGSPRANRIFEFLERDLGNC